MGNSGRYGSVPVKCARFCAMKQFYVMQRRCIKYANSPSEDEKSFARAEMRQIWRNLLDQSPPGNRKMRSQRMREVRTTAAYESRAYSRVEKLVKCPLARSVNRFSSYCSVVKGASCRNQKAKRLASLHLRHPSSERLLICINFT